LVEALAKLNDAIALDPSDALSYAYMGATLTSLGRPAEGVPHIRTAMRLDPHYSAVFTYLLGLAQFALEHYDEAAASFETVTRLNPDDEYPFAVLAATYGHLGRKADAVSAVARFNRLRVSRGNVPITIPTMPWLDFIRRVDVERVRQGLRLAGVPAVLSSGEFAEQNKLTADEVRLLFTGHRLHGHSPSTGEERAASLTTNGIAAMSGDWVIGGSSLTGGAARFQGDELCFIFGFMSYCGVVLRNPGGTRAMENEFIWHFGSPYPFSQVD
jgi:adenylate cyclase